MIGRTPSKSYSEKLVFCGGKILNRTDLLRLKPRASKSLSSENKMTSSTHYDSAGEHVGLGMYIIYHFVLK